MKYNACWSKHNIERSVLNTIFSMPMFVMYKGPGSVCI